MAAKEAMAMNLARTSPSFLRGERFNAATRDAVRVSPDPEATLASAFQRAVEQRGDRAAICEKKHGVWRSISWREYGKRVQAVATGLLALGFRSGDRSCIISKNRPEWLYADMAAISLGGISSGVYPTDAPSQLAYIVNDCAARVLFVEDEEQLDKAIEARKQMRSLTKIIVFDTRGLRHFRDSMVLSMADLQAIGESEARANGDEWSRGVTALRPDHVAMLVYTSGTTGPPKGARLSHRNLLFQVACIDKAMPLGPDDEQLSFLPLCHIAERLLTLVRPIFSGSIVSFAESPETVFDDLREVAPTVLFAVPRIWEKLYSSVTVAIEEASFVEKAAYRGAIAIGRREADERLEGNRRPLLLRLLRLLAEATVLRRTKKMIGIQRTRYVVTGAAPIAPDLIRWYSSLGVDMREAYGMTETTGVAAFSSSSRRRIGAVGRALPGTEIRIGADGEILIRGPHVFVGYHGAKDSDPEAVDREGWLHTGDIGAIDDDGCLRITDRMKDIIITAGGKNITPSEIENQLKFSRYISDAVVIGDRRKFLTALIMIDHENVASYAQKKQAPFTNYASLCRTAAVIDLIQREVDEVNARFARVEQIKKFQLIEVQLTLEDEELTPTMKLKRKFVNEKYSALIESMYEES